MYISLMKEKQKKAEDVLAYIQDGDDIIVSMANGEPTQLLDTIESHANRFQDVRIHQMHARKDRPYIRGEYNGHLKHVAYYLSAASRKAYNNGQCDLVPNNFHEVPRIMWERTNHKLVLTTTSPMDEHGYFSMGTNAEYVATFIGKVPIFLEVNEQMPRTVGNNQIHISQIEGYIQVDRPNYILPKREISETDKQMAAHIAELIPDGATIQAGIGGVPNAIIGFLKEKKHLGIHTEMLTDGIVDLVESGAVDGIYKKNNARRIVGTFALGTERLYRFLDQNPGVILMPVDYVNDPRIIGSDDHVISINSTTEVDFYGQCASETIGGRYYSSSGGQADFARGAAFSTSGRGFICVPSTTRDGKISRISSQLPLRSAVTTSKNDVHYVVTEYGAVNLKGKTITERAKLLISIAHPKFRDELTFEAKQQGLL